MAKIPQSRSRNVNRKPVVLIIDDHEEEAAAAKRILGKSVESISRLPSDVTDADLESANLVLVDFILSTWPERERLDTPSLKPNNGIALAANLRSNLTNESANSPTAFALRSGKLAELSGTLSPLRREHSIARMLDLEWVFSKGDQDHDKFVREVKSLALAAKQLPHPWPQFAASEAALIKLLKIKSRALWHRRAVEELASAFPPKDVLAETSKGMAVIRWMLHDVLPFPGFLLDERYIAARLHVEPASLRASLNSSRPSRIRNIFRQFEYTGLLAGFSGKRWWRAGIDYWLWEETSGKPLDKKSLETLVKRVLPKSTRSVNLDRPVVVVDRQFCPTDRLREFNSVVEVRPDDWPSIAEPAWIELDIANDDADVAARVVNQDRSRLD